MTDSKHASNKAEVPTTVPVSDDSEVKGTVRIAPAVLIQLIETTVKSIDGVTGICSHKGRRFDDPVSGKAFDDGKMRVIVDGDQMDVNITISLHHGVSVTTVGDAIRCEVGLAAGRMLGMTVRSVDIYVDRFMAGEV